jgi:hypothetical protein
MPSRAIRRFAYRLSERELEILFTTGRCYVFHDVPPEAVEAFRSAFSKGHHFNTRIRGCYRFTERKADDPEPGSGP